MQTMQTHKLKPTSEKIVLAWLEPSQRLFTWSVYSGSVYSRIVSHYVVGIRQDSLSLTEVTSIASINAAGKWFFDPETMTLYVRSFGSVDPGTVWTDVTYRLFFANAPIDLPATLADGGHIVPYDSRLRSVSKFKESFSDDQKGIALEGSGSLSLHNNDGYWAPIYDRLIWENKACQIFSFARDIALTEKVVLFNGVVTDKDFDAQTVKFGVKNFIYKLRSELDLPVYSELDGTLSDSLIGKPKRRLYGRVDGLLCGAINTMHSSYQLQTVDGVTDLRTGTPITVSSTSGSNVITANTANVHKDLCAGDSIAFSGSSFKVKSMARLDIGLDTPQDVTVTVSGTIARIAFGAIVTSAVSVGDHITLSVLNNALTTTKAEVLGHFVICTVNAAYLEFTLPVSVTSITDTFKTSVGEIVVTRATNTTKFTVQAAAPATTSGQNVVVTPVVPYRRFNRLYAMAHHALSTKTTTVTSIISAIKFAVVSVDGIYIGDIIRIGGANLSTIVGLNRVAKQITVSDVILPFPSFGTTVERLGIQAVTYKEQEFTPFADYTPIYDVDLGAQLKFNTLSEFNVATTEQSTSRASWLNGSKQVLGSNSVFAGLKPRDWICSETDNVWYEIAEHFSDNLVILNTPYTGTTGTNLTDIKRPTYLADASVVIANVYGRTADGTEGGDLVITAAQVVKDLMSDAGVSALVDQDRFAAASIDCPYRISMAIPTTPTGNAPIIRDILNEINDSVIGSLFSSIDGQLVYQILKARRSETDAIVLTESDVISSTISTDSSKIYRKVLIRFGARDADIVTEKPTYSVEQSDSTFVINSGIDGSVLTIQTNLYDRADAQRIAQRVRFMHELASSQVELTLGLKLIDASLNDLVSVSLDRIYPRLGTSGQDPNKTGLISSISKDGLGCKVVVDDLGNIFNRVATITPNDADSYTDASVLSRRFNGYITANNGLEDDDETTFNSNLIG